MDSIRIQYTRSGEDTVVITDARKKPRGGIRTEMGSEEDERKMTNEDKLARLEIKIQEFTYTLDAFMKASTVNRKPKRRKESAKRAKEELKEDDVFVFEEQEHDDFGSGEEVGVDQDLPPVFDCGPEEVKDEDDYPKDEDGDIPTSNVIDTLIREEKEV
ncbi:hypothetical protein MKW92_012654, partial [Papaver armeniacum]